MPFYMIQELDPNEACDDIAVAGGLGWWSWLVVCWFLPIVSLAGFVHLNWDGG